MRKERAAQTIVEVACEACQPRKGRDRDQVREHGSVVVRKRTIDEQDLAGMFAGKARGQVQGKGCLADSALRGVHRDDSRGVFTFLLPGQRSVEKLLAP